MKKTWIIIKREYLSRVRKKSFLITTLLVPLLMFSLFSLMIYLTIKSEKKKSILLLDESGIFENKLQTSDKKYQFISLHSNEIQSKAKALEKYKAEILIHVFPLKNNAIDSIQFFKEGSISIVLKEQLSEKLSSIYHSHQLKQFGIEEHMVDSLNRVNLNIKSYDLENNKETHSELMSGLGYAMGFLIYIVILIYGTGVMRGVMEEKTNRIAEIIISSVKPFQLMMGKIVGIAFVGLTQFLLWFILMFALQIVASIFLLPDTSEILNQANELGKSAPQLTAPDKIQKMTEIFKMLSEQNWVLYIFSFLFYFLFGYLLYASMFAAVGSLVNDDAQEAQQMSLPITMPIIFAFFIMISALKDPHGNLAIFGSLFPLTSPIVMLARIPYGVPIWQIVLSTIFLIGGFLIMTWVSSKIYRTGILMYGKKASWKEIIKWIRMS
ncbi:MAG: ABC transporter permease [Chitinophagaceae bacterium]